MMADITANYVRLFEAGQLPRSPRGTFYDLRPSGLGNGVTYKKRRRLGSGRLEPLGPMVADPATVQEVMALARRAGMIREDWVADERAPDPIVPLEFTDADEAVDWVEDVVLERFRIERQLGQDQYVEVWCEAAGIAPRLAIVCAPYGVPVYPSAGFGGLKGKREAAARIAGRDVPTIALQIGDYDLHGGWIFSSVAEDVAYWVPSYARESEHWSGRWTVGWETDPERFKLSAAGEEMLSIVRFAVTEAHVDAGLIEIDEEGKAEAEAMPTDWSILADELDGLIDPGLREEREEEDDPERKRLRSMLAERWSA
jgi:hypothetical protein